MIYLVNLDITIGSEIKKKRPCVLIGATPINAVRRTLVVIPLSTSAASNPPLTIGVSCLGKKVVAVCDQIRAVDKSRLMDKADTLSLDDLTLIEDGLRQVLCL